MAGTPVEIRLADGSEDVYPYSDDDEGEVYDYRLEDSGGLAVVRYDLAVGTSAAFVAMRVAHYPAGSWLRVRGGQTNKPYG